MIPGCTEHLGYRDLISYTVSAVVFPGKSLMSLMVARSGEWQTVGICSSYKQHFLPLLPCLNQILVILPSLLLLYGAFNL